MRQRARSWTLPTGSRVEGAAHGPLDALATHGASAGGNTFPGKMGRRGV